MQVYVWRAEFWMFVDEQVHLQTMEAEKKRQNDLHLCVRETVAS
jgi:hypothetical protein